LKITLIQGDVIQALNSLKQHKSDNVDVRQGEFKIGGITFMIHTNISEECNENSLRLNKSRERVMGCAFAGEKKIYMVNKFYAVRDFCNHEMCHVVLNESNETVCYQYNVKHWECEELLKEVV